MTLLTSTPTKFSRTSRNCTKKLRRLTRMSDGDAEVRLMKREIQIKRMAGFAEVAEAGGGMPEDGVNPQMLEAFLDVHLTELSETSITIIMSFCGEACSLFLPIAKRLLHNMEVERGKRHFA